MEFSLEHKQNLSSLIETELEMAKTMLRLLESEHEALTEGDPDLIKTCSSNKLQHMQLMEQEIGRRNQLLEEHGLAADEQGIEQAISAMTKDSKLQSKWAELKSTATKLQKQNEVNGNIITIGQRRVKQALDILSGKESLTGTYSQEGETQFSKSNNLHTKA